MKNAVVITDAAAAEIYAQFDYISRVRQSPMNAEKWLVGLYAAIEGLEDFAGYGRAAESGFLSVELRQLVFKSHRIVYSFDEMKRVVTIHEVRHGARRGIGEPVDDD